MKDFTLENIKRDAQKNYSLYIMMLPVLAFYILFCYKPMYGLIIAFKEYRPELGIWGSPWVGLEHFTDFMSSYYFRRLIKNTLWISVCSLAAGFPAPIILALLINELRLKRFAKLTQTITYMPHFVSLVVICGMIKTFTNDTGFISGIAAFFTGLPPETLLNSPSNFVPIYVISGIWQEVGWGSIIYLAALTAIDPSLYEAAVIDGASRFKRMLHITLPGIVPTIIILLILRVGQLMSVGYEKIILLYHPLIYQTSDVISTFIFRKGILETNNWSYTTAIGFFNSVINFIIIITANTVSRKVSETSLW
jgi:putative aldouronate transport system permease protein